MKQEFANEMAFLSLGAMAGCVMTDCEKYGMCYDGDYYNQTICKKLQCIIGFFKKSTKSFER